VPFIVSIRELLGQISRSMKNKDVAVRMWLYSGSKFGGGS